MTHRRRHDRPWPRRLALAMLVSTALLAGFAPASHASLLRRLDCAGIHYKGVTVAKIRERYHAQLGHLRCGKLRSLARAYYDVAAPGKRAGFRIPGFPAFRGYPGAFGGPVVRSVRDRFLVIKLYGPDYAPSPVQS